MREGRGRKGEGRTINRDETNSEARFVICKLVARTTSSSLNSETFHRVARALKFGRSREIAKYAFREDSAIRDPDNERSDVARAQQTRPY